MKRPALLLAALLLAALLGAFGYQRYREAYVEERRDGRTLAGVVTAAFDGREDLRVGTVGGIVQAKAEDVNALGLRTEQVMKAPFSADYLLDLSALSLDSYRWDEQRRTLTVTLPPVAVGRVDVDEARRTMVRTGGVYVSRGAAERLAQRVSVTADALARSEARKPEHLAEARANAKRAVSALIGPALAVAGLGDVRVVPVFADERTAGNSDPTDLTRSLREVLSDPKYRP